MNKAAVGIAIGSIALLGLTGVAASMSQTSVSAPTTSASASPRATRVTTSPTPVATRVATPSYTEPTAIPTTPAPLARTDESAPVVPAPAPAIDLVADAYAAYAQPIPEVSTSDIRAGFNATYAGSGYARSNSAELANVPSLTTPGLWHYFRYMSAKATAPAPVVVPVAPAPVPTVVPTTKVTIPPLGAGSGVDCAHLKPGDAFAGISQVCHLDPNDPLYTGPKPVTTPAPCATHAPDVTCQAIGCPVLPNK